ncbi:MAG: hypothetical protein WBA43_06290 [Elainellaceae cyanobacterium]
MAHISPLPQHLTHRLQQAMPSPVLPNLQDWLDADLLHMVIKAGQRRRWLGLCFGLGLLLAWNWLLVSAAIAGAGVSVASYQFQQGRLQVMQTLWQRLWKPTNRSLTLSVGVGGLTLLGTYLTLHTWLIAENPTLAIAFLIQGGGMLGLALLLSRRPSATTERSPSWDALADGLSDANPLKRLLSIRRATESSAAASYRAELLACFHLMLKYETDDILRQALLDGIQRLQTQHGLGTGAPSLHMPLPAVQHVDQIALERH